MQSGSFFLLLCVLSLIDSTSYAFFIPIMPDFLASLGISPSLIGVIMACFQIGYLLSSIYLSNHLLYISKKRWLIIGQIILILVNFGFASINPDLSSFLVVFIAVFCRFLQGVAFCVIFSIINYNLTVLYPEKLEESFARLEIWRGIGYSLGPMIGGLLYEYLSYAWCFLAIALIYSVLTMVLFLKILEQQETLERMAETNSPTLNRPVAALKTLLNKDLWLTVMVFMFSFMCYCVIQPKFSQHIHDFTDSESAVGLVFGISDFTYAISGFLVIHVIMRLNLDRRSMFILGGGLSMTSLFLIGPEEYTFLPRSLITIIIGMIMLGFSEMVYIPILIPEFWAILNESNPRTKGKKELACALFSFAGSAAQIMGSVAGGLLGQEFGFERGMSIYAMLALSYLLFYGLFRKNSGKDGDMEGEEKEIESVLLLQKT